MRDGRIVGLLLDACQECGALQLRDLWIEVALLAGDKEFTSSEIVAHGSLAENHRLRAAIESACGADYGAGKLGKLFARWAGVDIGGIVITAIGEEANAIVWSAKVNPDRTSIADVVRLVPLPIIKEQRRAR